jgi:DNA processing protein
MGSGSIPAPERDIHLIALSLSPHVGPVTIRRLLRAFGSAREVFRARQADLFGVDGISQKRSQWIAGFRDWDGLMKTVEKAEADGTRLVFHGDAEYPAALEELGEDAPILLFVKGAIAEEDRFSVAMVGSRKSSDYGEAVTARISSKLAGVGMTVVSGMARGIDTAAHRGALKAGGRTIAVLGCGLDVVYPPENRGLMDRIAASGAVISEFAPGTPPLKENFPRRNRLISGLSQGVMVVEAAPRSGSLITAKHALEQGKEVFAVPGNIISETSAGTNDLLKQGAKLVTSAEDVLEELAPVLKGFIKSSVRATPPDLTEQEMSLCDLLSREPVHVDEISRQSGRQVSEVLATLLGLELKGAIRQMEGKRFLLA